MFCNDARRAPAQNDGVRCWFDDLRRWAAEALVEMGESAVASLRCAVECHARR